MEQQYEDEVHRNVLSLVTIGYQRIAGTAAPWYPEKFQPLSTLKSYDLIGDRCGHMLSHHQGISEEATDKTILYCPSMSHVYSIFSTTTKEITH